MKIPRTKTQTKIRSAEKKRFTVSTLAACGTFLLCSVAIGQPTSGSGPAFSKAGLHPAGPGEAERPLRHAGPRGERFALRLTEVLELTDEQITAWEDLRLAHEAAVAPLHEQLRSHQQDLRSLLREEDPDPTAVGGEMLAARDLRNELEQERRQLEADFSALLTAEQLERYETIREMRPRHRDRGRRGGFGPRERRAETWGGVDG